MPAMSIPVVKNILGRYLLCGLLDCSVFFFILIIIPDKQAKIIGRKYSNLYKLITR